MTDQPKRYLGSDSAARKRMPITAGVLDYFPDAIAAVSEISFSGNEKHNPGRPLHWSRGKSMDHADCIARHLIERGSFDDQGARHSAQLAWRALALLQEELEAEKGLSVPRNAWVDQADPVLDPGLAERRKVLDARLKPRFVTEAEREEYEREHDGE